MNGPEDQRRIDLHTHSTMSDGSMTPAELVRHAKEAGLSAVALSAVVYVIIVCIGLISCVHAFD